MPSKVSFLTFFIFILMCPFSFQVSFTNTEVKSGYRDSPFDSFNYTNVFSLNYKNISTYFHEHSTFYIIVYDKYLQESADFMKVFIETADFAKENNMGIPFVIVNGKYNNEIFKFLPIKGFPSVFFVHKKKPYEYMGPGNKVGLLRFLSKKVMGAVFDIEKVSEIEYQALIEGRILLSTIKDKKTEIYKSLEAHAELTDDLDSFSCVTDECIKKYGEDIILLKNFDEKINKYSKDFGDLKKANIDSVYNFFGKYGIEMGGKLDEVYEEMLFTYNKKLLYYCRNESDPNQTKFDKVMKEVGKELRERGIYSLVGDITGSQTLELVKDFFAIEQKELPILLYYDLQNANESSNSYRINNVKEDQLNEKSILEFLKNIKNGKIKRDIRTERPMTTTEMRSFGAKYVVGKNFENEILNSKENDCVLFSMEDKQCPTCKEYLEEFRELSNKYKESVCVFAIFDARNNEINGMDIKLEELPFILFYKYSKDKDKKEVIKFVPRDRNIVSRKEIENFVDKNIKEDSKNNKNIEDL